MNKGVVYIVLATFFFSTVEIALKGVAGQFNAVQLNLVRFFFGGLALLPFAVRTLRKRNAKLTFDSYIWFAVLGFIGMVVSMTFFQLAVENTRASVVAVLFSCNPVFVLLFAWLILRVSIHRQHIIALVLECLGVVVLINPLNTSISTEGLVFSMMATISFALYAVLGTRQCARYSGVVVTCGSFLFSCVEMLILIALSHIDAVSSFLIAHHLEVFADIPLLTGYTWQNSLIMAYICIGVTGGGYVFYFMAMEETSPMKASLVYFFKPALTPVMAMFILGDPIPFNMVAGIVLILLGSFVSLMPTIAILHKMLVIQRWRWKRRVRHVRRAIHF